MQGVCGHVNLSPIKAKYVGIMACRQVSKFIYEGNFIQLNRHDSDRMKGDGP